MVFLWYLFEYWTYLSYTAAFFGGDLLFADWSEIEITPQDFRGLLVILKYYYVLMAFVGDLFLISDKYLSSTFRLYMLFLFYFSRRLLSVFLSVWVCVLRKFLYILRLLVLNPNTHYSKNKKYNFFIFTCLL